MHALRPPSPAPRIVALHCSAGGPAQWDAYRTLGDPAACWATPALQGYDAGATWRTGTPATLRGEAERVGALLAGTGGQVDLVGHSYGGAVALHVAMAWPARVRSVTVYEPVLFHLLQRDPYSRGLAAEVKAVADDIAQELRAHASERAGERFVDYWSGRGTWARLGEGQRAAIARRMPKVSAEFGALFAATSHYRELDIPGLTVRLVTGTASPAPVRRVMELLHYLLPRATLREVPGAGHMAPVQNPKLLAPLLLPAHRPAAEWPAAGPQK
nr:alpha/beta hydrolase [Caenimonas aquaedulcis]